ncbi:glycoside hydrolase family 10 protein [Parabacteroides chinchillae]|uniref:Glycosyl hydrolase-like 10 n=1 Tax=Parabacteroides chinchillae TaxID=871327 RepID=A0A8G2BVN8_9BACT|nr:hypothetical protein [Parabacteroides chinchillae]SEF75988.1 hypothetical protein SAMN05444001_10683 [Parabacteroides chinchillae]
MKTLLFALAALAMTACCSKAPEKTVKVYAWQGEGQDATEQTIQEDFSKWHAHGVDGMCYNVGYNLEKIQRAAKIAKANGMEYHAWIPTMLNGNADSSWYAINRKGESAYNVQAYVPYYKFMCPNNDSVINYIVQEYSNVADIPEVDYIHLDYIRYVDVILAKGLWDKYGLVMNEEYPTADYCYCPKCVADFKAATGIDILTVEDPSKCPEWAQFRCDVITNLVNKISDAVHAKGKKLSAAVFPGPDSHAKWMVRQEWDKWNLDAVFPMNYNDFYLEPASWLAPIVKEEVETVGGKFPVYSGLFICHDWQNKANIKDPEGHGLLPSEIEEAVRGSMENGAAGITLFTPNSMTDEHWKALDKAIHQNYTKK